MKVDNRIVRATLALLAACFSSFVAFVLVGFLLPGLLVESVYGSWEELPLGTGFLVLLFAFPVGLLCMVALPFLTAALYGALSPGETPS